MADDQYQKIIAAWAGNPQQGGSKEGEPKVAPTSEPNLADKLGVKAIPQAQLQALAMLAVAREAEFRGFEAGLATRQAEIDAQQTQTPGILRTTLTSFMRGTEGMPDDQIPPMFNPANKHGDIFDKGAAAVKKTGRRLFNLAITLLLQNLPEEFRPKE